MLAAKGRVIMISGANRGIGFETAKLLDSKGYFLSLAARICYSIAWNFHGIRDYTCLYRAYSISVLEKTFESRNHTHLNEKGFLASTELLRLVFKSSKNVTEIPIIINYSNKLQPSSMKIFKTIFKTLKVLIFKFD